jgi:cytoskeleton protein RodZ
MANFGERLRAERERRGITLDEVATATKVGPHLLDALERNDLASLPGGPFNKGFVRAYARHVGLDPETAVDEYAREERAQGLKTPDADRELLREMSRLIELRREGERKALVLDWSMVQRVGLLAVFAAVLALGGWYWLGSGEPEEPGPPLSGSVSPGSLEPGSPLASGADTPAGGMETANRVETAPPPEGEDAGPQGPGSPADVAGAAPRAHEAGSPAPAPDPATGSANAPSPAPAETGSRGRPSPAASGSPTPARTIETAASPPPPPPAVAVDPESHITISEAGVGTRVAGRELVGRGDRFPEGSRVYFWTRALGGNRGDPLRHVWLRDGQFVVAYDLTIGGSHWRNWSRKTLSGGSVGRWAVEARDAEDRVLARAEFDCVPPESP